MGSQGPHEEPFLFIGDARGLVGECEIWQGWLRQPSLPQVGSPGNTLPMGETTVKGCLVKLEKNLVVDGGRWVADFIESFWEYSLGDLASICSSGRS